MSALEMYFEQSRSFAPIRKIAQYHIGSGERAHNNSLRSKFARGQVVN